LHQIYHEKIWALLRETLRKKKGKNLGGMRKRKWDGRYFVSKKTKKNQYDDFH